MNNQYKQHFSDVAQIHRANILKSLEHRLTVARDSGKTHLVQQLEAEQSYYNC